MTDHTPPYVPAHDEAPFTLGQFTPTPPPPPLRRVPPALLVGLVVAALAMLGLGVVAGAMLTRGGGSPPLPPRPSASAAHAAGTLSVSGSLLLTQARGVMNLDDVHCTGMSGYDDIRAGTQVVVTDPAGTVIATGALSTGRLLGSGPTRQCVFDFAFTVPTGRAFYGVAVGRRGTVQYSESDLRRGPDVSLG